MVRLLTLKGTRVTIRPPREEDIDARLQLLGHSDFIHAVGGGRRAERRQPSREAQVRWLAKAADSDDTHEFAVEVDGHYIGIARLAAVDLQIRRARMSLGIHDPGVGTRDMVPKPLCWFSGMVSKALICTELTFGFSTSTNGRFDAT